MLAVSATIDGDKAVVKFFGDLSEVVPAAVTRGLRTVAYGVFAESHKNLSGPGRTTVLTHGRREYTATGYRNINPTKSRGQHSFLGARPGSYPVPILTGNLRGHLAVLEPGQSKSNGKVTFTAGQQEFVVYDSAAYAVPIHEGTHSSKNHGRRPYIDDGLKTYDNTVGIATQVEEELQKELNK